MTWNVARMKWIGILCVLCAAGAAAAIAAETAPVQAGDTVYIAASFKKIQHPKPIGGASVVYDMAPCRKFTVKKADSAKNVWVVEDAMQNDERLEGPWLPRMFKSEDECKSAAASMGEPQVKKSGMTFKLVESGAGAKN